MEVGSDCRLTCTGRARTFGTSIRSNTCSGLRISYSYPAAVLLPLLITTCKYSRYTTWPFGWAGLLLETLVSGDKNQAPKSPKQSWKVDNFLLDHPLLLSISICFLVMNLHLSDHLVSITVCQALESFHPPWVLWVLLFSSFHLWEKTTTLRLKGWNSTSN